MPLIVLEKPSSSPPAHSHSSVVLPPHPLNHPPLLSPPPCASAFPFLAVTPHLPSSLGSLYEWHCWAFSDMFSIPLLTVSIRLSEHRYIHARLFLPVSLLPSIPLSPLSSMALCLCIFKQTRARIENLEPPLSADIFDYITPSPWTSRTLQSNFIR